jgi:hypothetical protein
VHSNSSWVKQKKIKLVLSTKHAAQSKHWLGLNQDNDLQKGVIRSFNSKKNRQRNSQKKLTARQNTSQKTSG